MLTNAIGGLQGIVDHVLVGNLVGYKANAAIGVSWQIFLVVIVFISSLFTGMSVLVARFAGAGDAEKVDRVVYQAFLTAIGISLLVMAPVGYVATPWLLDLVNATDAVKAEAQPYLRILFGFSTGMLIFFMFSGALRSAGDARTPMMLGIAMTVLNLVLNIVLIRGLGPIPAFGTRGSAMGTCITAWLLAVFALWKMWTGGWVVAFPKGRGLGPDWGIIRELFRFGLPTGIQGIAMNVGGVLMLSFIGSLAQSAAAQAAFAVSYSELFSLITWTSVGLMGSAAAVAGQNLGAGHPDRAHQAVHVAARSGLSVAAFVGLIGTVRMACPEILSRHRRRRSHEAHRRPGDQREQLRIRHRECGLRGRALRQRSDERQHQHAADVHRDSLNAGRQAKTEQLADDSPVRTQAASLGKRDDPTPRPHFPQREDGEQPRRNARAHRRTARAKGRDRPQAANQHDVQHEIQYGHRDTEHHRRPRVAGRAQCAAEHEEDQHAGREAEQDAEVWLRFRLHRVRGIDEVEEPGRRDIPDRRHHQ